jgi:hypothetical protein
MSDRDELDQRIRSLQAERLRPVPPRPTQVAALGPPRYADLGQLVAEMDTAIGRRRRTKNRTETPGPSAPTETTRKDNA